MGVDYRMHGSKISSTSVRLFEAAGVNASRLDRYFDKRVAEGWPLVIGSRKGYRIRKLREQTGIPVDIISRQRRTILLRVAWPDPYIVYEELSQKKCYLDIPGAIPETIAANSVGKKVSDLVEGLGMFGDLTISSLENDGGRVTIYIKQSWQRVR